MAQPTSARMSMNNLLQVSICHRLFNAQLIFLPEGRDGCDEWDESARGESAHCFVQLNRSAAVSQKAPELSERILFGEAAAGHRPALRGGARLRPTCTVFLTRLDISSRC
jgi:hypothetical protein